MRPVDMAARDRVWTVVLMGAALAIGLATIEASVKDGVGRQQAAPSGEQMVRPVTVEIGGETLRLSVPPTWRQLENGPAVMFAPEGGHAQLAGKPRLSYGIA